LRERLKAEKRARVIFVNSEGHRFALGGVHLDDLEWRRHHYTGLKSYGAAKTAQLLTMKGFNAYFAGSPVTVNAMHPGNVKSNIGENNGRLYRFLKHRLVLPSAREPEVSARALYYLAAEPALAAVSGTFFNLTTPETPAPHATDEALFGPAWNKSLELCGLT
jgi:NAD(P)-dependent dehydrogenase (short-subunit alcohol dehydrogenase family)